MFTLVRPSARFRTMACGCAALVLFGAVSRRASAQFNASLSGTVEDTSGAVIPGAKVSLQNMATQASQSTVTSSQGYYHFSELGPGNYTLTVQAKNFQKTSEAVALAAETPRDVDVQLAAGASSQTVTVNANQTPLLQTADASVGSSVSSQDVTRLPIFGRDPYELVRSAVGTTADGARNGTGGAVALPNGQGPGQSNYGIFQTENQIQVSASGQRVTSNTYLIDGVSVDSLQHGGSAIITPNPESVAQISVTTSSFDAAEGRNVGAHIATVTKSGGNQFHGSLFFQYDEPGLNAYQAYGGPNGALPLRVENKQREYAASLGGPLVRNRLFWFTSYEGVTNSNTNYSEQYILAPPFLAYLKANRSGGLVNGILNGPGGGARIIAVLPAQSSSFNLCTNLQTLCKLVGNGANVGAFAGGVDTYTTQSGSATSPATLDGIEDVDYDEIATPARFRGNQYNARVDWNISSADRFTASEFVSKLDQTSGDPGTGAEPISDLPFKPLSQSGTLIYIHTFSSRLINEARGNYTRFADNQIGDSKGLVNWGVPRIEVQGYDFGRFYAGADVSADTPGVFAENTYEVRDTLTQTAGSHTIRYGGEFRWEQDNDNLNGLARPDFVFQGIYNLANDTPVFEQVAANPATGGLPDAQRYFRDRDFAAFVQHDWKATPNLTLNTGLRYEYFSPLYNKGAEIYEPVLGSAAGLELVDATLQPRNHLWDANSQGWAPKIGFAWSPSHYNHKMVVRGGIGISYDRLDDILFVNGYQNGPNYFQYGLCCGTVSPAQARSVGINFALGSSDSPFSYVNSPVLKTGVNPATNTPNTVGGFTPEIDVYGAFFHTPQPILYSMAFATEYELPGQMALTVGYQGSLGHHFPRLVDQNFLYCTVQPCQSDVPATKTTPFSNTFIPTSDVFTNYNALNLHLEKRYQHGFNLSASYTYSKSMDQGSNEGPGALSNQTDPADPRTEYGPSDFDVRHRVTVVGLWDLPSYRHGKGLLGQALGGWQMNGIYTYHTGFPWTPVTGVPSVASVQSAATIAPTRPLAYYGGAHNRCSNGAYIHGTNFPGIGATAPGLPYFKIGTPGPPGIGRNSWNGPCYMDTDMSFAKQQTIPVGGRETQLRFQANFYNIFNKTNLTPITFGSSEATIENTVFGRAPSADAGRVIEFLARFQF